MHARNDPLVPVLRRFILRFANRENRRSQILPLQFRHLAIAKGLRKRWKTLEQVSELRHGSDSHAAPTGARILAAATAINMSRLRRSSSLRSVTFIVYRPPSSQAPSERHR